MMTNYNERLDKILSMFDGGIHAKGSDKGGYPTYFTEPYPLWVEERKRAAKQAILRWVANEVIGEDENEHYEDLTTHLNPSALARNSLRAEQRAKLKEVMGGER